jgi:ABC-type multidrug transport system fused ATPase/permease subunit
MLTDSGHTSQLNSRVTRVPSVHGVERDSAAGSIPTPVTDIDAKTTVSLYTQASVKNFSQRQWQLTAVARALPRRNNILILDEATRSIDFATDTKIQTTIREEFRDSLLLTSQ